MKNKRNKSWVNHEATPNQQKIVYGQSPKRNRPTQAELLIEMLRRARQYGKPLMLPEIMALGIAQHTGRIFDIRARGFKVTNNLSRLGSVVHSSYVLEHDPERDSNGQ